MKYLKLSLMLWLGAISTQGQAQKSLNSTIDSLKVNTLEEVVITGQFEPQSIKNSVYKVRTITNEQIRLRASTSVENILNTQLGIRFSNDLTLGESDIQLMGMSGQNVKVLMDGIPLVDRGATKQSLSQIDVNTIERIEVVEGPMSVVYGTDALAGVINIITKKRNGQDKLIIGVRVQEETAGREYNALHKEGTHNGNLSFDWQKKGWQLKASGSRNNFGGWQGKGSGRVLDWNPKNQWLASGTVGFRDSELNIWYRLDYLDEDIYTPGLLNSSNLKAIDKNYFTSRYNHVLQSDVKVNARLSVSGAASYQNYERATQTMMLDFKNNSSELTSGQGEQDVAKFSSVVFRSTVQYMVSDQLFLQPGIEVNSNSGSGERIKDKPTINDYAFFISSEIKPLSWLNIRPGFRFIQNSVYDAPPVIPSINTKLKFSDSFDLRAAYARGFRAPALRELYFTFFDANHSIQGNENLNAENSNSYNAYFTWYGSQDRAIRLNSTLGGFYNNFDNQITVGMDQANSSVNTYINIDKFKTAGTTFENTLHLQNLTVGVGFSYIGRYNRISESETNVPSMLWSPEVNTNLLYSIPKWKTGINFFYKFNGERPGYEASPQADGAIAINRSTLSPYHLADLTVNKSFTKGVTLVGGVRNLFNITDIVNSSLGDGTHSSSTAYIPVSYGRSFFLGLNIQWTK